MLDAGMEGDPRCCCRPPNSERTSILCPPTLLIDGAADWLEVTLAVLVNLSDSASSDVVDTRADLIAPFAMVWSFVAIRALWTSMLNDDLPSFVSLSLVLGADIV